jgi:hypothetical protein
LLLAAALVLQEPPPGPPPQRAQAQEALRVYLDCGSCDLDFLRTEMTFVNYVRDQRDAQVYVLVTTQATGANGIEYTLTFIGQQEFEGRADTLRYAAGPDATDDIVRRAVAHAMMLGLMRYVARTPIAEQIEIRRRPPGPGPEGPGGGPPRQGRDPWTYWVFSAGISGYLQGEVSTKQQQFSGNLSANRITEQWKVTLSAYASTYRNTYELTDTSQFVGRSHSYSFTGLLVRSLGANWSAGIQTGASSSTYSNKDYSVSAGPAVEYDIWPYAQSTRRQLRLTYALSAEHDDYDQVTLYNKTVETLFSQSLNVALALRERFGTVNLSVSATQYLHDLRRYDVGVYGAFTFRLVKGLSFSAGGSYSRIRDQLYLPAQGATPEEILVRLRQLATTYNYFTSFGLTYTFGSIYNNVVNPRFGSSGSGASTCMCF